MRKKKCYKILANIKPGFETHHLGENNPIQFQQVSRHVLRVSDSPTVRKKKSHNISANIRPDFESFKLTACEKKKSLKMSANIKPGFESLRLTSCEKKGPVKFQQITSQVLKVSDSLPVTKNIQYDFSKYQVRFSESQTHCLWAKESDRISANIKPGFESVRLTPCEKKKISKYQISSQVLRVSDSLPVRKKIT